jgi:hypothetical protein
MQFSRRLQRTKSIQKQLKDLIRREVVTAVIVVVVAMATAEACWQVEELSPVSLELSLVSSLLSF